MRDPILAGIEYHAQTLRAAELDEQRRVRSIDPIAFAAMRRAAANNRAAGVEGLPREVPNPRDYSDPTAFWAATSR